MPPVRFIIPEPLLQELRALRDRGRIERASSAPPSESPSAQRGSPPYRERIAAWLWTPLHMLRKRLSGRPSLRAETLAAARRPLALPEVVAAFSRPEDAELLASAFFRSMNDLQAEVEAQHDAFLLDPGMGPMTYLTADGRVLLDNRTWNGDGVEEETSLDNAVAALVVGAYNTGTVGLLALVPKLPGGTSCPLCEGARMIRHDPKGKPDMLCNICRGWGEVNASMRAKAAARGLLP